MLTEDKVTEIFCMADNFCKFFDAMTAKYTLNLLEKENIIEVLRCQRQMPDKSKNSGKGYGYYAFVCLSRMSLIRRNKS